MTDELIGPLHSKEDDDYETLPDEEEGTGHYTEGTTTDPKMGPENDPKVEKDRKDE
jgi:hypothetical protein